MFLFADELNLAVLLYRAPEISPRQFLAVSALAHCRSAAQREQRIVRNADAGRAQDCGQSYFICRVVEKAQQLNQVGDLFAFEKALALNGHRRNPGASQSAFVSADTGERAKEDRDVAVFDWYTGVARAGNSGRDVRIPSQFIDSFDYLSGVMFARIAALKRI